jgi:predicted ferric reductase
MSLSLNSGASRNNRLLLIAAYLFILSAPLMCAKLLAPKMGKQDLLFEISNDLILLVFPLLALQPMLAARFRRLDRWFGLDIIYVFHKIMGMTAGTLLACVPIFLAAAGNESLTISLDQTWQIVVSAAGATLLLVLVVTALLYQEFSMNYEQWRRLHNVLALMVLLLVFAYGIFIKEAHAVSAVTILWVLLFIAAIAAYINHKFIGPYRRRRHSYRVEKITQETHNVWTVTLAPPKGMSRFDFSPGQFQFLTFYRGKQGEEHPFTISSSPTQNGFVTSSIKESGDFTKSIREIRANDRVAIQAPFGRFSYVLHPEEHDTVFIAGGIGITPFMSMLRHMRDTNADKDVLLLYANVSEQDIVFRAELDAIAAGKCPRLNVVYVLNKPTAEWRGERGFIDRGLIRKYCRDEVGTRSFYICGPPTMMTALIATVIELGAPSSRVRSERFAL